MKRPTRWNTVLSRNAAERWAKSDAKDHVEIVGSREVDLEQFAAALVASRDSSTSHDASDLARRLARRLHMDVDTELLEIADEFLGHHETEYQKAVTDWVKGWGPAAPFEGFARVEYEDSSGDLHFGVGNATKRHAATAHFLFLDDLNRERSTRDDGFVSSWSIIQYEDVKRVSELMEHDRQLVEAHLAATKVLDLRYAEADRTSKANAALKAMIDGASPPDEAAAQAVYDSLAGTPEKAASIIAALGHVARREIRNRPRIAPPGSML